IATAVYPNPASQYVSVRLPPSMTQAHVDIFSSDGRQVYNGTFTTGGQTEVPLNGVLPGIYFVTVATDRWKETHRLVVE
ncbi:MAG: T9SS type A sorting domain-containing protein, partial [Imperialibacter sp.]